MSPVRCTGLAVMLLFAAVFPNLCAAMNGPCASLDQYEDLDRLLVERGIEITVEAEHGTRFVCWRHDVDSQVQAVLEEAFGRAPDDTALGIPEPSLSVFVRELDARGIPYQRYSYMGHVIIDWRPEDDERVARALSTAVGFDLARHRKASLDSIRVPSSQ